mmetsp:Transcript_10743/g.29640  ORF Transcript_10743/g.29640 Transcript_10743/m.29640 type:complete len:311 (-) Transcript_10743:64-996(-)
MHVKRNDAYSYCCCCAVSIPQLASKCVAHMARLFDQCFIESREPRQDKFLVVLASAATFGGPWKAQPQRNATHMAAAQSDPIAVLDDPLPNHWHWHWHWHSHNSTAMMTTITMMTMTQSGRSIPKSNTVGLPLARFGQRFFALLSVLMVTSCLTQQATALQLTPQTTPESVVRSQLDALQIDDIYEVFKYASPSNKAMTGPWQRFSEMVRSPPYHHLVGHARANVVLEVRSKMAPDCWGGLVQVLPPFIEQASDDADIDSDSNSNGDGVNSSTMTTAATSRSVEFWWYLSRCTEGPYAGCYMVDSVKPKR